MKRKLPGDYIAGFIDGEGHFGLKHNLELKIKRKGEPTYWRWSLDFAISLSEEDQLILEMIKDTLGCGTINAQYGRTLQYRVYNFNDICNKIVPFFEKYPLRAKKKQDFILWKEAAEILRRCKGNSLFKRTTIKPIFLLEPFFPFRRLFQKERLDFLGQTVRQKEYLAPEKTWLFHFCVFLANTISLSGVLLQTLRLADFLFQTSLALKKYCLRQCS